MRVRVRLRAVKQRCLQTYALCRRQCRRLRARWRLHRLEWRAQYRALDEDEPLTVRRTATDGSSGGQTRALAAQEHLDADEPLFRDWIQSTHKNRWQFLRHFVQIYFRTWGYGARSAPTAAPADSAAPADTAAHWAGAFRSLHERVRSWDPASAAASPLWKEQWKQVAAWIPAGAPRTGAPAEAPGETQSLEQAVQSRIRALRESIQAFRAGYEKGLNEGPFFNERSTDGTTDTTTPPESDVVSVGTDSAGTGLQSKSAPQSEDEWPRAR